MSFKNTVDDHSKIIIAFEKSMAERFKQHSTFHKNLIIALVGLCFSLTLASQNSTSIKSHVVLSENNRFYEAFVQQSLYDWKRAIELLEKTGQPLDNLQLLNVYYGYIGWCIRERELDEANLYLNKMKQMLKENLSEEYYLLAYQSAILGFGILLHKEKAILSGSKSLRLINQALQVNTSNPLGYIIKANIMLHMPRVLGGSIKSALNYFEIAITNFERHNNSTQSDWLYLHTLCTMFSLYEQTKQPEKAQVCYQKIMANEPDLKWLKATLKQR